MKKYLQKPSIWLLIFLVGFPQISETIYTPSLPELTDLLNTTGNRIQQTLSIYFIGFAVGVLLWGILSDKIGRRPSMLLGVVIYIIGSIGCLLSTEITVLLSARFIQAMGAAAGSIVTQTVMRDVYDDKERPQVFAKISAVLAFSPAVGPLLGGTIAQYGGVNYVFLFLVLLGIAALLSSYKGLYETKQKTEKQTTIISVMKRMLLDKNILIYAALIGINNGIIFSYYAEMPFIFIDQLGFSSAQYGLVGFIVALATFVGAMICKTLSKKIHFLKVMMTGYGTMLIGVLLFLITAYTQQDKLMMTSGFIIGVFFIMCGIGISLPPCLSNALINYKDCLGISGAFLGLLYYLIVSITTEGISILHNGQATTLPYYLLTLTIGLVVLTSMLRQKSK